MCTLIVGVERPQRGHVLVAANRDEALARPSDPPGVLRASPRVVGGRDRVAGGTWLAARTEAPARLVAVLNRRAHGGAIAAPGRVSRGLLCLEAAAAPTMAAARAGVADAIAGEPPAPLSLVLVEAEETWAAYFDARGLRWQQLEPGFHALTHGDADDAGDARVAVMLEAAAAAEPGAADAEIFAATLRRHDGERAVCLHGDGYGTVSSALLEFDLRRGTGRWRFAPGPPCVTPYADTGVLAKSGAGAAEA